MDVCRQFTIGVKGEGDASASNPLFPTLASLFPVEFRPWTNGDCRGLDALILSGQDLGSLRRVAAAGLPVFAALAPSPTQSLMRTDGFFLEPSPTLTASLRSHHFEERESILAALPALDRDDVLASQDGRPIWLRRCVEGADVTMVSWPLPYLGPDDHIYENFQTGRFLRLLSLLQFLRNLTSHADWQSPPTPACLLVDDPNLHSTVYGHLDFRRLAAEARAQQFYVSVATVPLDCWWVDRQTTDLFRENAPRISIVVHGNNHTSEELARPASELENLSLLAQALRRCRRLEQQSGIEFCRLMECPHGSVSVAMLEPMARLGYEAVFASMAHLLRCNRGTNFRASLGAEPTLLENKAVPIVPRIRALPGWQDEVRLAAFLKRPIIFAVHHWDFADQNHLPGEFAQVVNSLPDTTWATPTGVARACYQYREIGDVLHVRLSSRLVDVPIAQHVRYVVIHRPWLQEDGDPELLEIRARETQLFRAVSTADVVDPVAVQGATDLQISSSLLNRVDCDSVPSPRFRCWPLVRKLMMEVRDRSRVPVHLRK